ncbi:MAG: hypothetical protein ABH868_07155 [bacterium]
MYTLRKLCIMLLALVFMASVTTTSFAARKRTPKASEAAPEVAVEEEAAPKKKENINRDEEILFSFEQSKEGWEVPDWAWEKADHVAQETASSSKFASAGKASLEVKSNFPGKKWTAAYLEYVEYFDWSNYSEVAVDFYVPKDTPVGLLAKIIITVGEDWKWVEMRRPERLTPGEWVTVRADLMPGSTDWRRVQPTDEFRMDVRKLGLRVESDKKPVYEGPFYIDNVRLTKIEK